MEQNRARWCRRSRSLVCEMRVLTSMASKRRRGARFSLSSDALVLIFIENILTVLTCYAFARSTGQLWRVPYGKLMSLSIYNVGHGHTKYQRRTGKADFGFR